MQQRLEALTVTDKLHTQRFAVMSDTIEEQQQETLHAVASATKLRLQLDQLRLEFDQLRSVHGRVAYTVAPLCMQLRECMDGFNGVVDEWDRLQRALQVIHVSLYARMHVFICSSVCL